jgi:putative PIN family toxin of toxin-antitoxin system
MINAVLDTNVIVSGLLTERGNSALIIDAFKEKLFTLIYNNEIFAEYQDVLRWDKLGLPAGDIDELLEQIKNTGFPIVPAISDILLTDEDDRIFYDTAKVANAYLVTGNIKHYPQEQFIIPPADFIVLISK